METVWKSIGDKVGYTVSNTGLVKSSNGVLKQQVYRNYLSVCIEGVWYKVHRLVAEAFIPNPDNKPQVNHKDYNTYNNHAYNLNWVTAAENVQHSISRMHFNRYRINQLDPTTKEVLGTYPSCQAAVKAMGGKNNGSAVAKAIKAGTKSYGYYWERATTSRKT